MSGNRCNCSGAWSAIRRLIRNAAWWRCWLMVHAGTKLLNDTMKAPSLRSQVEGSVAIIRESGVTALDVGERYEVGYLPWWERLWHMLADHPVRLAGITLLSMLLLGMGSQVAVGRDQSSSFEGRVRDEKNDPTDRGTAALLRECTLPVRAACDWPEWEQFKRDYITAEGRVIDSSDARRITTSEGQSYALFFSLVNDDRETFEQVLNWTERELAKGDLTGFLPAWLWGKTGRQVGHVLDANSAADSDLWIAYSLLEAGRLWQNHSYESIGTMLLRRIAREEVARVPGLGLVLLPGPRGFAGRAALDAQPRLCATPVTGSRRWHAGAVARNAQAVVLPY